MLAEAGFECALVEFAAGRSNLVERLPGSGVGLPLCFTGHVDVVPLGTAAWKRDPFGAEVVDGTLHLVLEPGSGPVERAPLTISGLLPGARYRILDAEHVASSDGTVPLAMSLHARTEITVQPAR